MGGGQQFEGAGLREGGEAAVWLLLVNCFGDHVLLLPLVLPVLPTADTGWAYQVAQTNCESVGWPQLV